MMMSAQVVQQIETAFESNAYPGDDRLIDSASLEAIRVRNFLRGRLWQSVTLEMLRTSYAGDASACLEFLSPAAGLYYMPAFLRISVLHYFEADMISVSLCMQLAYDGRAHPQHFMSLVRSFTPAQEIAVARSLAYICEVHEAHLQPKYAETALDRYWRQFL